MKRRLISFKRVFSGICIAVFVIGHGFSAFNAVLPNYFPVFLPTVDDTSSTSTEASSFYESSYVSMESLIPSEVFSSSLTSVSVPTISNVLSNSKYQETSEDKKNDPMNDKYFNADKNNSFDLIDTVPKKDIINPVEPYVIRITGNGVRLRTEMASINSTIYGKVNAGTKIKCIAVCTSKDGSSWLKIEYKDKELFVSDTYAEKTNDSLDVLNSQPQSSSSAASSGASSTPSSSESSSSTVTSSNTSSVVKPSQNLQGWQKIGGKTYYYVNNKPVTGWQVIGGLRHLFDNTGVKISKAGIDVSSHQKEVDWESVKEAGIEFAIIRVAYRGYGSAGNLELDDYFEKNVKGATKVGIPFGVYIYSAAVNEAEAIEEANLVLSAIKGYKFDYPVIYDVELYEKRCENVSRKQFTNNTIAFLETIKAAGYKAMYYTNRNFIKNYLEYERLKNYDLWLAVYSNSADDTPVRNYNYKIWQYSQTGKINGIKGNVDLNIQIKDV